MSNKFLWSILVSWSLILANVPYFLIFYKILQYIISYAENPKGYQISKYILDCRWKKKNRLSTLEFIFNKVLSFSISSQCSYTSNVHRNEKCEKNVGVFKFQKKLLISFFFTTKSILTFRDLKISFLVTCCKNTC